MPTTHEVCDRAPRCLNFRLDAQPPCDGCGVPVRGNHYHDNVNGFRICEACFVAGLAAIVAGGYAVARAARAESRICRNRESCFQDRPYGRFVVKTCHACGREEPPQHFHDVVRNERTCLACHAREAMVGREGRPQRAGEEP